MRNRSLCLPEFGATAVQDVDWSEMLLHKQTAREPRQSEQIEPSGVNHHTLSASMLQKEWTPGTTMNNQTHNQHRKCSVLFLHEILWGVLCSGWIRSVCPLQLGCVIGWRQTGRGHVAPSLATATDGTDRKRGTERKDWWMKHPPASYHTYRQHRHTLHVSL